MSSAAQTSSSALWVAPTAGVEADGSAERPFGSIQQAVDAAGPGVTVFVRAGLYIENIVLPDGGGEAGAPLQLISVDGDGAAVIQAASAAASTIKGLGTDHLLIRGFHVVGGLNGIQISQNGLDFGNLAQSVRIENNTVEGSVQDLIKIDHADDVQVLGNTLRNGGGEAIDFVAVNGSIIAWNDVSQVRTFAGAIMVKGGSSNILVQGNHVHDSVSGGIDVGGATASEFFRPGFGSQEASNVLVVGNQVEDVRLRALNVIGAADVRVAGNLLASTERPALNVIAASGDLETGADPARVEVVGNVFKRTDNLLSTTHPDVVTFRDNTTDGAWSGTAGPAAPVRQELAAPDRLTTAPVIDLRGADAQASLSDGRVARGDEPADIEGGSGDDAIYGTALGDRLVGGDGFNMLIGGDGDDVLVGGLGDVLMGGQDEDRIVLDGSAAFVDGGSDVDTIVFSGFVGPDLGDIRRVERFLLGEGADVDLTRFHMAISLSPDEGLSGRVRVLGSRYGDTITGGLGDDRLDGGLGDDILKGGEGDDVLTVRSAAGTDRLDGGSGGDTFEGAFSASSESVVLVQGGAGFFVKVGGAVVVRGESLERLSVDGGRGADALSGGRGSDTLTGGLGDDQLSGSEGDDRLDGGGGGDLLLGGAGSDELAGGEGADVFRFDRTADASPATPDRIIGFTPGVDRIDFHMIDADLTAAGDQAFEMVGAGPFTRPGQVLVQTRGDETWLMLNNDADAGVEAIIILTGALTLATSDFSL